MLTEEALIVLVVLGAVGLLMLGILELVWPTRPRHPVRDGQAPPTGRRRRSSRRARSPRTGRGYERRAASEALAEPGPSLQVAEGEAPTEAAGAEPSVAPAEPPPAEAFAEYLEATAASADGEAPAGRGPARLETEPPPLVVPPAAPSALEECFALYQARRFEEVVELGATTLRIAHADRPGLERSSETAALWAVVGLAKQGLGDLDGARSALDAAIQVAPDPDRPTYQRHLAALALGAARGLVGHAQNYASAETDERVTAMRSAIAWLERGLAAVPGDPTLTETRASVERELWPAYGQVVATLIQRQEFHAARRLLRDAMADERFPETRGAEFRELLLSTFSGEIGQLTAHAIRTMQEGQDSEALAALRRAEELLVTIPDEALSPKRREEVEGRLWWGYTKLGARRVETGDFEEALDPLLHALSFASIGPERQDETRFALVRALEGIVETRALMIHELAERGDRDGALIRGEKLWALLRSGVDLGLAREDLAEAFAKTERLFAELGRGPETPGQ